MPRVTGIGLYPDDPCYDPNRSSLLPYWLNTWNEDGCFLERKAGIDSRMNFNPPPGGYSPGVPEGGYSTNPGEITQEEIIEAQRRKAEEWRKNAIPPPPGGDMDLGMGLPILAALGIGLLMFLPNSGSSGGTRRRK